MKNFKLNGVGSLLQLGKSGPNFIADSGSAIAVQAFGGGAATLSVATPTAPDHAATKEYVDNNNALVLSGQIFGSNDTGVAGEMSVVTVSGLSLNNSDAPNPLLGQLLRWDGLNWLVVPMSEGMRISTASDLSGQEITFADGHIFVLESIGASYVWLDNGPQPSDSFVSKGVVAFKDETEFLANQIVDSIIGNIPADSYINTATINIQNPYNNDIIGIDMFHRQLVPTGTAFYNADLFVGGLAENVNITADNAGTDALAAFITGDGVSTIDALIATWNGANPANTITLLSGNGTSVLDNGETANLGESYATVVDARPLNITAEDNDPFDAQNYQVAELDYVGDDREVYVSLDCGATVPTQGNLIISVEYTRV